MDTRWQTDTFARLNAPLQSMVGDKTAKPYEKLRVHTVGDLLRHIPRRYFSGTENSSLAELTIGEPAAIVAHVTKVDQVGQEPRRRVVATVSDGTASMELTFFSKKPRVRDYWVRQLSASRRGIFVGKVTQFNRQLQMTHPTFVMLGPRGEIVGKENDHEIVEAVSRSGLIGLYPQTSALPTWSISGVVALVLDQLPDLAEPLPEWVLDELDLPTLEQAFHDVHLPDTRDKVDRGLERLRFDEALGLQLTMAYRRADAAHSAAPSLVGRRDGLLDALDAQLPFELTEGQQAVSREVMDGMARPHPMQRLLQGEVGSGKTLVALRAMCRAIDSGQQAVLMAPTEVLAAQHYESLRELMGGLAAGQVLGAPEQATEVVLLTGSMTTAQKKAALLKIASGEAGIVIGTHAVLSDRVMFADLGLVVVDEQHRFGVEQRAALLERGELRPHVLVMTATPIPRSVAMTVFADLATSSLREIPAGRSEVQTTVVNPSTHPQWLERAWQRIREEVAEGRQAFVVCSRISANATDQDPATGFSDEDAEKLPPAVTVEDLAEELASGPLSGLRLATLHGRMSAGDKEGVMAAFAEGKLDVLVATTVIEVGVNVPNASVMVVMDADRFGISQLHQLRGRIGRGRHPGLCLLVSHAGGSMPAVRRLEAVASTRDGFALAEADLQARREGNILGAAQAGARSTLKLLRVLEHADLISVAREVAEQLVEEDPKRENPYLADIVRQTELLAAGDWLERS